MFSAVFMPRNICQGNIFIHSLKQNGLQSFIYHVYTCVYLIFFKSETAQVGKKYFTSLTEIRNLASPIKKKFVYLDERLSHLA